MRVEQPVKRLQTTVGDLVVAAMDVALEVSRNQQKAYRLAGIVLNKMLNDSRLRGRQPGGDLCKRTLFH